MIGVLTARERIVIQEPGHVPLLFPLSDPRPEPRRAWDRCREIGQPLPEPAASPG
jgi:hypothetical protein